MDNLVVPSPANEGDIDPVLAAVRIARQIVDSASDLDFQLAIIEDLLERVRAKMEGGRAKPLFSVI